MDRYTLSWHAKNNHNNNNNNDDDNDENDKVYIMDTLKFPTVGRKT
jgi:hypothetical protein